MMIENEFATRNESRFTRHFLQGNDTDNSTMQPASLNLIEIIAHHQRWRFRRRGRPFRSPSKLTLLFGSRTCPNAYLPSVFYILEQFRTNQGRPNRRSPFTIKSNVELLQLELPITFSIKIVFLIYISRERFQ